MYKRLAYLAVIGLSVQTASAQEFSIDCQGVSTMTIFNPHGNGGTKGGPTDENWTIRTDGKTFAQTFSDGSSGDRRDVRIEGGVLSYCDTGDHSPCDVIQPKTTRSGPGRVFASSVNLDLNDATLRQHFWWDYPNASMKTGVENVREMRCDAGQVRALVESLSDRTRPTANSDPAPENVSDAQSSPEATLTVEPAAEASGDLQGNSAEVARRNAEAQERYEEGRRQYEAELERQRIATEREEERMREASRRAEEQQRAYEEALEATRQEAARRQAEYERKLKEALAPKPGGPVEWKEGVVLCEPRQGSKQWRCSGPLQMNVLELDGPNTNAQLGLACGSSNGIREIGQVGRYRAYGCGFGIHPTARNYPGNRDIPEEFGVYVSDRRIFHCPASKDAYCRTP